MSDWRARLTSAAIRDLDRLPARVVPAVVEFLFGPLADEPTRVGKPRVGELAGLFGARRGEYRVRYELLNSEAIIVVHRIAHRADAYRPLQH